MTAARNRDVATLVVPAIAVVLAVVLLVALVVAALRPGTASAATVVQRGDDVVAQLADGSSRALAVGDQVPRGALVVAGRDGAVLRTRDRDTWLGGGSAVTVVDGGRQELREGLVMVDARRGPALLLTTPAAEVRTPDGAVSRVEGGPLLRVGAYDGAPLSVQPAGRNVTTPVARDFQVQVPESGLPGRVTPLVLTPGDPYERALAPQLVAADEALRDLAARLDAGGQPGVVVRTAADSDLPAGSVPAGAPVSERTLAYLLARAADAPAASGPLGDRYDAVRSLRGAGGSWGVVADLVQADVSDVAGLLDALLEPGAEALAAEEVDLAALLGLPGAVPESQAPPAAASPGSAAPAAPSPPRSPTSGPRPPADETPDPVLPLPPPPPPPPPPPSPVVDTVVDTVDVVVDVVVDLLPSSSSASTTSDPQPAAPEDGLVGTLLK